jgi:hypothetical protein
LTDPPKGRVWSKAGLVAGVVVLVICTLREGCQGTSVRCGRPLDGNGSPSA